SLRHLATAGEACSPELVQRWAPTTAVFNLYGPSETTVWSTVWANGQIPGADARGYETVDVTIGRPIHGFSAAVLDARLHPVPVG
ncbi:AMP-binding protein, partial [Mycobacterium tuberculosis]|uniref:AMP-binding protein n=1 Tax=Mycobacterium tuberculosis TaxID=1773 RepID=UPI001AE3F944|nr:AMP-binding protein [Mycobacterium tuberculosis]